MFGRRREETVGASLPSGLEKVASAPRCPNHSKRRRVFPLQKAERPPFGGKFRWYRGYTIALSRLGSGRFL